MRVQPTYRPSGFKAAARIHTARIIFWSDGESFDARPWGRAPVLKEKTRGNHRKRWANDRFRGLGYRLGIFAENRVRTEKKKAAYTLQVYAASEYGKSL